MILCPLPDNPPNPDCPNCGGDGVPPTNAHRILAAEWSYQACPECWDDDEADE